MLLERLLGGSPGHADASHLLGLVAIEHGDYALARQHITRAIEASPGQPVYYYNLGLAQYSGGDLEAALSAYEHALVLNPGFIEAHINRGMVLFDLGRMEAALASCESAIRLDPGRADPHYNRGNALSELDRPEEALSAYERALALNPDHAGAHNNRGNVLRSLGRAEEALSAYDRALVLNPDYAEAHANRGNVLSGLGRMNEALSAYDQALQLNPGNAEAHTNRGNVLSGLGRSEEALAAYERALEINPDYAEAQYNLGLMLELQGRLEEAYLACSQVLESNPGYESAIALQAGIRRRQGRYHEAIALLDPLLQGGIKHPHIAEAFVSLCHHVERCEEALSLSTDVCSANGPSRQDLMCLHFSTGHALDRLGRFDEAFAQFDIANRLRDANYDISWLQCFVDASKEVYDVNLIQKNLQHYISTPRLVFIIGMPRSGTTLAEQILSSHPDVYGAGELAAMPDIRDSIAELTGIGINYPHCMSALDVTGIDILRNEYLSRLPEASHGVPVVTDKHLGNSLSVGLIRTLFPDAIFIHCIRDPLDSCLSCYINNFTTLPYTYDLTSLGQTWREHRRLMQYWQDISIPMMILSYEALVGDHEGVSRELVEYCGLQWNEACLYFHKNDRRVLTLSSDQVNRPMYSSSVGRWRNYESHLGPLIDALNGKS